MNLNTGCEEMSATFFVDAQIKLFKVKKRILNRVRYLPVLVCILCVILTTSHMTTANDVNNNNNNQPRYDEFLYHQYEQQQLFNITHLLYRRFQHLFQDQHQQQQQHLERNEVQNQTTTSSIQQPQQKLSLTQSDHHQDQQEQQSQLETRKIIESGEKEPLFSRQANQLSAATAALSLEDRELSKRNYIKVLNRVFSRVDLPELYKASQGLGSTSAGNSGIGTVNAQSGVPASTRLTRGSGGSSNNHCGLHIGCIEEIPNFPSLLRKSNVSSSFTLYTRENSKLGFKINYEPIIHHQLQDASSLMAAATVGGASESSLNPSADESSEWDKLQDKLPLQSTLATPNAGAPSTNSNKNDSPLAPMINTKVNNINISNNNNYIPTSHNNNKKQTSLSWRMATKIIKSQEYPFNMASLEQSGFNSSLVTRIIVGGYFAKEDEEWIDEVVKQWLILEPRSNIIKVSWADANRGLYHSAAYNSRIVARQLTLFLYYLDQMFHIDLNRFHLVGHSLGAHIAGFVGADNGGKIARITGLDPAGPIFVELNASMRLDQSDAKFVDVMHTNGGTITKGALGLSIPSGHVDYYCNGGSVQPGCYFSSVTKSIMDPVERVACSHRRSYRYFIEIIKLAQQQQQRDSLNNYESDTTTSNMNINNNNNITSLIQSTNTSEKQQQYLWTGLTHRDSEGANVYPNVPQKSSMSIAKLPRAFLFEAKQEDLVKLMQPEISLISHRTNSMRRAELNQQSYSSSTAPLKRHLEFHLLNPEFPPGKRGLYFFKTRSESPFFASKQYALTLKTDTVIRRKIALLVKLDNHLVAEVELDEIPGIYTLTFAPNDPKIINLPNELDKTNNIVDGQSFRQQLNQNNRVPQLSLMWRHRTFNLLLSQQNELHLNSIELSLLDSDEEDRPMIKYHISPLVLPLSPANLMKSVFSGTDSISLTRNQWYKFDGKFLSCKSTSSHCYY